MIKINYVSKKSRDYYIACFNAISFYSYRYYTDGAPENKWRKHCRLCREIYKSELTKQQCLFKKNKIKYFGYKYNSYNEIVREKIKRNVPQ